VKKFAGLIPFHIFSFALLLLAAAALRFLAIRLGRAEGFAGQGDLVSAVRWALPLAVYGAMLLGLARVAVEGIFAPAAVLVLVLLSLACPFAVNRGLERLAWEPAGPNPVAPVGPGLILADRGLVLVDGSPEGMRVRLSVTGFEVLRGPPADDLPAPPVGPSVLPTGIAGDLSAGAERLYGLYLAGPVPFLLYLGPLLLLLGSLVFILRLGPWPLANFFLGALAFRGILALETAFGFGKFRFVLAPLSALLSEELAVPALFLTAALVVIVCLFLVSILRRRKSHAAF